MIKQILLFALVVIIAFLSCSSNKKLVVEQTNSNYPIILVKGKNSNKIATIRFPLVFNISKSSFENDVKIGSLSYLYNSSLSKKATWMAGAILYSSQNDELQPIKGLQKIDLTKKEFVVYTRHYISYSINDDLGHFFQPYYDYMSENSKDTLHIESLQQLKKREPDLINAFLQGDSLLFRVYYNNNLIPYTVPVQAK
ncbi:hypothetical protein [uncultured Bacteroides sp.]|uniref:hypothetical protein n=1 Tax=uncultured Bacteroides sp. TaxID=162156 RepID=UPI0026669B6C|nr:hypothetical protein [uncultured Bacteroides sp.]